MGESNCGSSDNYRDRTPHLVAGWSRELLHLGWIHSRVVGAGDRRHPGSSAARAETNPVGENSAKTRKRGLLRHEQRRKLGLGMPCERLPDDTIDTLGGQLKFPAESHSAHRLILKEIWLPGLDSN